MKVAEMTARIAAGEGFIAALDQSGGSTPKALRGYGISDDEWSGDEEMFGKMHEMRSRVITAPSFANGKIIGAILFERTMDGIIDGKPAADALKSRGVVPFVKVDQGLQDVADGVQLMKPLDKLPALLEKSVAAGMFGTKMRSVIKSANTAGIAQIVAQQFAVGKDIIAAGLMPILEPEYDITADDRAQGEGVLKSEILAQLDALPEGQHVMLKLSIPKVPGAYSDLIAHPKVLQVVALSGGYSTEQACAELAKNPNIIASFSRGLLQDLRADQSDAEFDAALGKAINTICAASIC